jgi:hypothetical protein
VKSRKIKLPPAKREVKQREGLKKIEIFFNLIIPSLPQQKFKDKIKPAKIKVYLKKISARPGQAK